MDYDPEQDIFRSDAVCLVNTVNTVGVMGKGLARAFATRYPEIVPPYRAACESGAFKAGGVQLIGLNRASGARAPRASADLIVANLATKEHWRNPSKLEWVDRGLAALADKLSAEGISSVAIPKVGAGLGGLDWARVAPVIARHFEPLSRAGMKVTVIGEAPEIGAAGKGSAGDGLVYAGIGARKTPDAVCAKMESLAGHLARRGWILRSGGADGADRAFERGARAADGKCEIFVPWEGFNDYSAAGQDVHVGTCQGAEALAARYHPAWDRLNQGARKLMARNGYQVFGAGLRTPVRTVVCWTEGGRIAGGTGQALRMAADAGCDVVNLGDPRIARLDMGGLAARIESGKGAGRARARPERDASR